MNIIEALKALYVAFGGNLTDTYETIADGVAVSNYTYTPDMIQALAKVAPSSSIELPKVTSSDNGKVLTVVSGEWAKADLPE